MDAGAGDISDCQPADCVSMHKRPDDVKDEPSLFLKLNSYVHFHPVKMAECFGNIDAVTRQNQIPLSFSGEV
jgi:hypothetical protein